MSVSVSHSLDIPSGRPHLFCALLEFFIAGRYTILHTTTSTCSSSR